MKASKYKLIKNIFNKISVGAVKKTAKTNQKSHYYYYINALQMDL